MSKSLHRLTLTLSYVPLEPKLTFRPTWHDKQADKKILLESWHTNSRIQNPIYSSKVNGVIIFLVLKSVALTNRTFNVVVLHNLWPPKDLHINGWGKDCRSKMKLFSVWLTHYRTLPCISLPCCNLTGRLSFRVDQMNKKNAF